MTSLAHSHARIVQFSIIIRSVKLIPGFSFEKAEIVNVLEEKLGELPVVDGAVELNLKPYQILSIRFI